jgi:hypothetical protein
MQRIDSLNLVRQLDSKFKRNQSVAIMRVFDELLTNAYLDHLTANATGLDNYMYLIKSRVQEVRSELNNLRQTHSTSLKSDAQIYFRQIEFQNGYFGQQLAGLKSDLSIDLNNHKSEIKDALGHFELKTVGLGHKLVLELSSLKTDMEKIKVQLTRFIVWWTIACLFGLLAIDQLDKLYKLRNK